LSVITDIEDLRVLHEKRAPRMFYDYCDSGAWTERTYRSNQADLQALKFRQRVAVDVDKRSIATTMLGQPASMPVALAPTGLAGMQWADGEILAARAAEKFGVPFTLSTMSICSIEDVAAHVTKPFWFQLYVLRDRAFIERLIERARAARCSALVLTLDLTILGQRHKDVKNGLSTPPKPTLVNLLNLLTKPRWCSNMLGTPRRQFGNIVGHVDGVGDTSSLASWTSIEVWFDSGIRSGQDVLRAVALGAKATMIGRAWLHGLGAMGEAGVTRCLEIIRKELDITMAFCGKTDIRQVDRSILLPPRA
jgi:L-lactate dehydrogenase (cytochrome)